MTTTLTTTLTIGANRGAARLWIQGNILTRAGWLAGSRWSLSVTDGTITLTRDPDGARKVSGNARRPVIDSKDPRIGAALPTGTRVCVLVTRDTITIEAE
jgi:hypothetical protein